MTNHPRAHAERLHHRGHPAVFEEAQRARRVRLGELWRFATEYVLLLPLGAAIALLWANTAPETYFTTVFTWPSRSLPLEFWINDVAMALFFGWVMKEVVEATAPGGVLHSWRRVTFPVVASVGMTILPAIIFAVAVTLLGYPLLRRGWPTAFATDLAVGYLVARIIFGKHPAVPFFLLLGIAANALGIIMLAAVADQARIEIVGPLMLAAIGLAVQMRRARVKQFWPYVLGAGTLSWLALYFGGLHPALALVPIIPFLPHAKRDPGFFVDASPHAHDALSRFELWCRHPAQIALFLFGLTTAGVALQAIEESGWSLPIAALIGKPLGLLIGAAFAAAAGLHLPNHVGWRHLTVVGLICGVGFTMALYFATASIAPGPMLSGAKFGALMTLLAAPAAALAAGLLHVGRFARPS